MRMSGAGLRVPPGVVLTTAFFTPWVEEIESSQTWSELITGRHHDSARLFAALKQQASALPFTLLQKDVLKAACRDLTGSDDETRFAVRSSSPDEDAASASFAGLYETRLGVQPSEIEVALRHCFGSALDVRVVGYKHERGIDPFALRFAAILQRQIDSHVAGVGFSLNPVTNDYDEAVIASSWGLGPSVVDGRVSADHLVVDKVSGRVLAETRGEKRLSVRLDPAGGTIERREDR
jgi:rifampicin phosphotransferase